MSSINYVSLNLWLAPDHPWMDYEIQLSEMTKMRDDSMGFPMVFLQNVSPGANKSQIAVKFLSLNMLALFLKCLLCLVSRKIYPPLKSNSDALSSFVKSL